MSTSIGSRATSREWARERLDHAIGQAFVELSHCRHTLSNLLAQTRAKSSLLRITGDGSQQLLALEGLRNIARSHDEFLAWPSTWAGGEASVYALMHGLACHLFGRYPVPRGFGLVWFGGQSEAERLDRRWFIAHARGQAFREIDELPIKLSRQMERILLSSPHHLPLRSAIRRAEILGLRGEPALVDALLATRLATDLDNAEFWRTVIEFFIRHRDEIELGSIARIVEKLHAVRFRAVEVLTPTGRIVVPPPDPEFSLAGRTPSSLERQLASFGVAQPLRPCVSRWASAGLPGLADAEQLGDGSEPKWVMVELLDADELRREGQAMRHCVASYASKCRRGQSSIWSLRELGEAGQAESRCTIEVQRSTRTIVQIRGYQNHTIGGWPRQLVERWAAGAELDIAASAWGVAAVSC